MASKHSTAVADEPEVKQLLADPPVINPLATPGSANDLVDTTATQGTRFSGPILSGQPDAGPAGIGMLYKRLKFNVSHGTFTIPVNLGPGSILVKVVVFKDPAYGSGTTPTVGVYDAQTAGNRLTAADQALDSAALIIESATAFVAGASMPTTGIVWVRVNHGGATIIGGGAATLLLQYCPNAKTMQS